jgi:hypothetical protein
MPRFVILYHNDPANKSRPLHCDLMFENDGVLRTWATTQLPYDWASLKESSSVDGRLPLAIASSNIVDAEQLADHRLAYLGYEGPISGDRGIVRRVEAGDFTISQANPDVWNVRVQGGVIRGEINLQRVVGRRWQLTFQPHGLPA